MQVICISRGTFSGGKELAEKLAKDLGYRCLSREELIEAAIEDGIQVGKLEMAMVKPGIFSERLALEREHYLAFTTAFLCERAMEGRLVYHGRTGHLLLPGVGHVLRVRVVADEEYRIKAAMRQLGVERDKARRYLEDVDEDRRHWVHHMYGVSWEDASNYDVVFNLQQFSVANAAASLTAIAQLPDFRMTPASLAAMKDLYLAARARVILAKNELTYKAFFKARANDGVVTVSYLPHDAKLADDISAALAGLDGSREIRTTMATTNILWIQQGYDHSSEVFKQVVEIATKWNAAVELVRLDSSNGEGSRDEPEESGDSQKEAVRPSGPAAHNGGVEDDVEEAAQDDKGMKATLDELARLGRSGGGRVVRGGQDKLVRNLDRGVPYTLVVIGDVFVEKGPSVRQRMTRDLQGYLGDHIKAPVVTADELKSQFLFGARDLVKLVGFILFVIVLYIAVFTHQEPIMRLLIQTEFWAKAAVAAAVFLLVPVVAFSYGNVANALFKLIKME